MDVENRIKEYRIDCGLTQEELARRVGVTRQTIIAIEKGNYTPSVSLALKLAQEMDTRVETLFWLNRSDR
jgi:putative transcriptional regulator